MYLFWEEYLRFLNVQSSSRYSAETQGGAKFGTHVLFSFNSPFNVGEATPNTRGVAAQAGRGARRGDGGAVEEKRSPTRSPLLSHPASKGLVEAGRRTRSKMDGEVFSAHRPPFPRSRLHLRWRNARTFFFPTRAGRQRRGKADFCCALLAAAHRYKPCRRPGAPACPCLHRRSPPRKGIPLSGRGQRAVQGARMLEAHPLTLTLTLTVTRAAHLVFKHRTGSFTGKRLLELRPVSL